MRAFEEEYGDIVCGSFEASVSHLGPNFILTIPVEMAHKLELKKGDIVRIQVHKTPTEDLTTNNRVSSSSRAPCDTIRVLHVDDETDELRFTKLFLEETDPVLQVESVLSPEEALRLLQRPFDCIVSDYKMPSMDGIEFARKIKETSSIPFVLYTGRGSEEVAEAAFAAGVDDYVRKELDPGHYQVLANRIRTAVEKHRAEEQLRESEARFRDIAERSIDTIFSVDLEGYLTYVSPSVDRIIGYGAEEVTGKPFQNFMPESKISMADRIFNETLSSGSVEGLQFDFLRRDGSRAFVEINASTIIRDGEVVGIQGIVRDITELKHYEGMLHESEEKYRTLRAREEEDSGAS